MNLLLIMSDEHRRDAMGCAGHPVVRTPTLDALAERGTRFANAYTPCPMCVPARAAIATGAHCHRIGAWDSTTPYAGAPDSWMHLLRGAGARTASIGKLHFRNEQDDAGFDEQILPMHVDGEGWTIGLLRDRSAVWDGAAELARDAGEGWSDYAAYDARITTAAEAWLRDNAKGDPWALKVSFVSPHYPLTAPPDAMALYDPDHTDAPVPPAQTRHPEVAAMADFWDYDRHFTEHGRRVARAAYYGLISYLDANIRRVLSALEQAGAMEDTLILYASDHGEMLGDHGLWTKQVMFDASAGAPLIMAGPRTPEGVVVDTPASLLDIHATALDLFGLTDQSDGESLLAQATGAGRFDRTVLSQYHDGGSTTGAFMVRWGRWKYIHYHGQPPQLFDMVADPQERNDCASDPASAALVAEGRARLSRFCDPAAVTGQAFADQADRIAALGGRDACVASFNHTPVPE